MTLGESMIEMAYRWRNLMYCIFYFNALDLHLLGSPDWRTMLATGRVGESIGRRAEMEKSARHWGCRSSQLLQSGKSLSCHWFHPEVQ